MSDTQNYITLEKKTSLEEELAELTGPKRKEILESLKYAKSLGDLSENAEYHQAREDQGKLESRIAQIESILKSAVVVEHSGGDVVSFGSKVSVENLDKGILKTYIIVGPEEADMLLGKISNRSPFGEALFGKKKGDKISFNAPNGVINYKIIEVS